MKCENCGGECYRDEVDIGVGYVYGPYGCPSCGWSESTMYDRSQGNPEADKVHPEFIHDQFGGAIRRSAIDRLMNGIGIEVMA
jgi:hypothetical protein